VSNTRFDDPPSGSKYFVLSEMSIVPDKKQNQGDSRDLSPLLAIFSIFEWGSFGGHVGYTVLVHAQLPVVIHSQRRLVGFAV
jgi:hypothetical protein